MRGFLRSAIVFIVVVAALLAGWRLFGGDPASLLLRIWDFVYLIINGLAQVFTEALRAFGVG